MSAMRTADDTDTEVLLRRAEEGDPAGRGADEERLRGEATAVLGTNK